MTAMMEAISDFVARTSGSFTTVIARKTDVSLPMHTDAKPRPRFQVKALLGHCLYRRVVIWTTIAFALLTVVFFDPRLTTQSRNVLHYVHGSKSLVKEAPSTAENILLQNQDSIAIGHLQQEVVHEVKLGVKVEVVEDAANDATKNTPNDVPNNIGENTLMDSMSNDEPHNTPNQMSNDTPNDDLSSNRDRPPQDVPEAAPGGAPDDIIKDDAVHQDEDTSQNEGTDGPKWLKYKQ